jgi:hypothetical protein
MLGYLNIAVALKNTLTKTLVHLASGFLVSRQTQSATGSSHHNFSIP